MNLGRQTQPKSLRNWLLVPSPLLGPASWGDVASILKTYDQDVTVPSTTMTTTDHVDHVAPWLDEVLDQIKPGPHPSTVVVGHSAACPRLPLLTSALIEEGWNVESMIMVDGRLPDGRAFTESEPNFARMLDGLVRPDDYLPPWPRWWGSLVEGLVVEPLARDLVFAEARPIPRTWFDQPCVAPELPTVAKGFLCFGQGYQQSRDQARDLGWSTATLFGDHLHQVVSPKPVAATLMGMADCLAGDGGN